MPNKLQFKLLSDSGELLSVVTCHAGKISVLRAAVPSDLRPYQRALGGSTGKENLQVICDGKSYRPEEHILIGFGEPSPTVGLTVKEFLAQNQVPEESCANFLRAVELETVVDKRCADLSVEQESRLRLLAATTSPGKIIILNDPFENISGQRRERMAELLATFTETQKAIVVIPALSFRPECWVNNQNVERIEVGQTSQGTIGFGSTNNATMSELLNKVRNDPRFAGQSGDANRFSAAALGASYPQSTSDQDLSSPSAPKGRWFKTAGLVVGATVASCATLLVVGVVSGKSWVSTDMTQVASLGNKVSASKPSAESDTSRNNRSIQGKGAAPGSPVDNASDIAAPDNKQRTAPVSYVLDSYPSLVRASLLDTIHGVTNVAAATNQVAQARVIPSSSQSGNLFSLLEKAGSDNQNQRGILQREPDFNNNADAPDELADQGNDPSADSDPSEEEARREEIRNRFLAAIQAAAQSRQESLDGGNGTNE